MDFKGKYATIINIKPHRSQKNSYRATNHSVFTFTSGIGGGCARVDLAHRQIVGLFSLFAKTVVDDILPIHFLLPGRHSRIFITLRTAGLHDYALQPVIGFDNIDDQFDNDNIY